MHETKINDDDDYYDENKEKKMKKKNVRIKRKIIAVSKIRILYCATQKHLNCKFSLE